MISVNAHAYKGRGLTYCCMVYQYLRRSKLSTRASFFRNQLYSKPSSTFGKSRNSNLFAYDIKGI